MKSMQIAPKVISDGAGSAILVSEYCSFHPELTSAGYFWVVRIDTEGQTTWATRIKAVGLSTYEIICDGSGGIIVGWWVVSSISGKGTAYVQRLNAEGEPLWGEKGVKAYFSFQESVAFKTVADGMGGAIVVAGGDEEPVRAQRISSQGELLWGDDGIEIRL